MTCETAAKRRPELYDGPSIPHVARALVDFEFRIHFQVSERESYVIVVFFTRELRSGDVYPYLCDLLCRE